MPGVLTAHIGVEDRLVHRRGQTGAVVVDEQVQRSVLWIVDRPDRDQRAGRRVLHRVRHEVVEHPLDQDRIAEAHHAVDAGRQSDDVLVGVRLGSNSHQHRIHVELLTDGPGCATEQPVDRREVGEQLGGALRIAADPLGELAALHVAECDVVAVEEVRHDPDGGQWRAEIVRHRRHQRCLLVECTRQRLCTTTLHLAIRELLTQTLLAHAAHHGESPQSGGPADQHLEPGGALDLGLDVDDERHARVVDLATPRPCAGFGATCGDLDHLRVAGLGKWAHTHVDPSAAELPRQQFGHACHDLGERRPGQHAVVHVVEQLAFGDRPEHQQHALDVGVLELVVRCVLDHHPRAVGTPHAHVVDGVRAEVGGCETVRSGELVGEHHRHFRHVVGMEEVDGRRTDDALGRPSGGALHRRADPLDPEIGPDQHHDEGEPFTESGHGPVERRTHLAVAPAIGSRNHARTLAHHAEPSSSHQSLGGQLRRHPYTRSQCSPPCSTTCPRC